jgi:hypothetical protein
MQGRFDHRQTHHMTWIIYLAAFNGTLFTPLASLPTFKSAEACYNFVALTRKEKNDGTRMIRVPR